ncbi:MAG: phosphoribosyltransferase family protein [Bacillota bacterium]
MRLIAGIIDLLFPPRRVCPLCGSSGAENKICPRCLKVIAEYRREPVCFKCGRYFQQLPEPECAPAGGGAVLCRDCGHGGRYFRLSRSAGPYEGDLKRAVLKLKYSGRRDLAGHLAGLMFQSVAGNPHFIKVQVIAAVPLSPERLRQRGFNQSELLAAGMAEKMAVPLLPLLRKVRETPSQTGLSRAGREANLVGAFQLSDPGAVRGKTVLLVDDVITTGSTLNVASETLIRGGAAAVVCITAAAGRTFINLPGSYA